MIDKVVSLEAERAKRVESFDGGTVDAEAQRRLSCGLRAKLEQMRAAREHDAPAISVGVYLAWHRAAFE